MVASFLKTFLGVSIMATSIYLALFVFHGAPVIAGFIHGPSLLMVGGMLLGLTFLLVEFKDYLRFFRFLFGYSVPGEKKKLYSSENSFVKLLDLYSGEGTTAFRAEIARSNFPKIWAIVANKLEIRVPVLDIRTILKFQIRKTVSRLDQDIVVLKQLATLAPALGLFATVIGLIGLLQDLKDFSSLGSNMSLALIATLYGIFVANVLLVPLIRRVENRKYIAVKNHENITYWLKTVEDNKPSYYLKNRLKEIVHVEG